MENCTKKGGFKFGENVKIFRPGKINGFYGVVYDEQVYNSSSYFQVIVICTNHFKECEHAMIWINEIELQGLSDREQEKLNNYTYELSNN